MTVRYTDPFGPQWKLPWLRMMTQWDGSIFQVFAVEWVVAIIMYAIVLAIWFLRDDPSTSSVGADVVLQPYVLDSFGYVTQRFQDAVSLMLGFYTSTIYTRWWSVRVLEGVVIGRINDLSVQIAALVRDEPRMGQGQAARQQEQDAENDDGQNDNLGPKQSDKRNIRTGMNGHDGGSDHDSGATTRTSRNGRDGDRDDREAFHSLLDGTNVATANDVRLNLVRWLNLAHALAVGDLYEKKPNEFSSLQDLVDFGMMSESEHEYMKDNAQSRYQAPFVWFLNLLQELKDKEYCQITDGTMIILTENVTRIRGSLADLYMYRNVPVPLAYRQLVNWTVRIYTVIFAVGSAMGGVSTDEGNPEALTPAVFFLLVPFAFEYFMFVGWLSLADALGNPFRAWADEFEYENYVMSVALGSNQWIGATRDVCTHLDKIDEITPSLEEKKRATFARWKDTSKCHEKESLRKKLTGF